MISAGYRDPFAPFRLPAVLLAFFIAIGTAGYALIERWSLFDSFYMTIITISTVGFTEVHPMNTPGRLFTSVLIVGGVGTMLYAFGVFAETLSEGHFLEFRRVRRLERKVNALRDHFIVCGYGRIGTPGRQRVRDLPARIRRHRQQPRGDRAAPPGGPPPHRGRRGQRGGAERGRHRARPGAHQRRRLG